MILIYTTCPNISEAKRIGKLIIDKRFAAAVNIWPAYSVYCWKDECKEGEGAVLFIRTLEKKLQDIEDLLRAEIKGGIPCVASLDVHRLNHTYKEVLVDTIR